MSASISSYLQSIFAVSLIAALCEFLIKGNGKHSAFPEKSLKLIVSLILCVCVLFPVCDVFKKLLDYSSYDTKSLPLSNNSALSATDIYSLTKKQLENDVSDKIFAKTGIKPKAVSIEFTTTPNDGKIDMKSAVIKVEKDCEKALEIQDYSSQLLGIPVKVIGE